MHGASARRSCTEKNVSLGQAGRMDDLREK